MGTQNSGYTQALRQCWRDLGISPEFVAQRGLPEFAEPETLITAEIGSDDREHLLIPDAASAWQQMKTVAASEAVVLSIVSAFRSIQRQIEIVELKLRAGQTHEQIFAVSAPPGCSEHHTGRAVDVATENSAPLEIEFESTSAFAWLTDNAGRFGFTLSYPRGNRWGYSYEPWHWCFNASVFSGSGRK